MHLLLAFLHFLDFSNGLFVSEILDYSFSFENIDYSITFLRFYRTRPVLYMPTRAFLSEYPRFL